MARDYDEKVMELLGLKPEEMDDEKQRAIEVVTDAQYPQTTAMMNSRPMAKVIVDFLTHCAKQGVALRGRWTGEELSADDVTPLLDSFFGVDRDALVAEKRRMIRDMRDILDNLGLDEEHTLQLAQRLDEHEARLP